MDDPHCGNGPSRAGEGIGSRRRRYVLRVTIGYALCAALWIGFSDNLLASLADTAEILWLSTAKGLLFVVVTTALLFIALRNVPAKDPSATALAGLESLFAALPGAQRAWFYIFAVAVSLAMLLVRSGIAVSFGDRPLLILFVFPVILSAAAGGLGPGLLATLLVALGAAHCLPPADRFWIAASHDFFQWGFLLVNGALVSILSEVLHRLRRQSEASRRMQAVTLACIGDGVITTDVRGHITFLNPKAEQLTGWSCGEATGLPLVVVFRVVNGQRQPVEDPVHKVLATGEVVGLANHTILLARDGRELPVRDCGAPIRLADGAMLGVVLVFCDDSERCQAEEALRESEKRFRDIAEISADWIWEVDSEGRYTYASENVWDLLGHPAAEIVGKTPFDFMPPEEAARVRAEFTAIAARREPFLDLANINVGKDGGPRHVLSSGVPILNEQGKLLGYRGLDRDVTEKKQAEEALHASLAEKTVLLKEVHHRVKNNLQVMASLLNLQIDRTANAEAVAALLDTRNRLHSMALLHEVLYRSESLARIDLAAYVEDLCTHLLRSFGPAAGQVRVERRVAPVSLPLEQAVPCGLIVNELVTNALKYGYPAEKAGRVLVEAVLEAGRIVLSVSDNGVGLPPDFDPAAASTLGLQLVMNLAGQLGGRLAWERGAEGGALFRVSFPVSGASKPGGAPS